jgi:hypothetical protein
MVAERMNFIAKVWGMREISPLEMKNKLKVERSAEILLKWVLKG